MAGSPRPVAAEAGLAAYRTAQEALTNARKHAPGQPVRLCLQFSPTDIAVRAANPLPEVRPGGPLAAHRQPGTGLPACGNARHWPGARWTAGPADGEWRVCLRIPA